MRGARSATAALAAVVWLGGVPATGAVQPPGPVEVVAARFYRGAGTTLVDGFCRVPFNLLEPLGRAEARAWYSVEVRILDGAGSPIQAMAWSQSVPADLVAVAGASAVEHFGFAALAGSYRVEVVVTDSASGRVARASSAVSAFGVAPLVSDLLLSSAVRRAAEGDTVAAPGEFRKGTVFLTAATRPVLTPGQARLFYYVELYPAAAAAVRATAHVLGADGAQVIAAAPQELDLAPGGGIITSGLDLTGLPPGAYQLRLEVAFGDTTVTRTAAFGMAGFETQAAVARAGPSLAADPYAELNEAQLDSLYDPLIYVLESDERGIFNGLSPEGKRNFLRRIWARRDPTLGTPSNEAQADFYRRIADANQLFREGGAAGVPGWRTDRGRIRIRYGDPDDVLRRPQSGPSPPYEVWKYTRGRARKFVFMDETRVGNYVLIYTDELREPSLPNWESLLGPEAVRDVRQY